MHLEDDLGRYHLAAITSATGGQAWLVRHDDDPNPGTVVYADTAANVADVQADLARVLGIGLQDFLWIAPVPSDPPVARYG